MTISIIIPAYNAFKTILNTLNSVKLQTYQDFEIIVVDDGSTDNTVSIIEKFKIENPLLNLILVKKKNEGVSKARNIALKLAKGNLIAFLDSDDEWLPIKLEKQIYIFRNDDSIDFVGTCRNNETQNHFFLKTNGNLTEITFKQLLFKMYFITPTVMFKSNILDDIGFFNEKKRYCEDADYFLRISFEKKCFLLNESLVVTGGGKAHFGERGLSSNLLAMEKGELENFNDLFLKSQINYFEYVICYSFSLIKFLRRICIVKLISWKSLFKNLPILNKTVRNNC